MSTIHEMLERWENIDLIKMAGVIIEENKEEYHKLNRAQMWDGLDAEGNDIRPNYLTDQFFPDRDAAMKYIEWKQRITPNPKRKPESPNLFINGFYYNSLDLVVQGVFILHMNTWSDGIDIDRKYHFVRGLSPLSIKSFWNRVLRDELIAEIAYQTGAI